MSYSDNSGGGIYVNAYRDETIEITNSEFVGNRAEYGGSVYIRDMKKVELKNCSFISSQSKEKGGALYLMKNEMQIITDSKFLKSQSGATGGGIYATYNTRLVIENCRFEENTAIEGTGAIYTSSRTRNSVTDIKNTDFISNRGIYAGSYASGALKIGGSLRIRSCRFEKNYAKGGVSSVVAGNGFGSDNPYCVQVQIEDSSFSGKLVTLLFQTIPGPIYLKNCLFEGSSSSHHMRMVSVDTVVYENVTVLSGGGIVELVNAREFVIRDSRFVNQRGNEPSPFQIRNVFEPVDIDGEVGLSRGIFIYNSVFEGNEGVNGGCFLISGKNLLRVEGSRFVGNSATQTAGVFYVEGQSYQIYKYKRGNKVGFQAIAGLVFLKNEFIGNSAPMGGTLYSKGILNIMHVEDCVFRNGSAVLGFDVVLESSYYSKFKDCQFFDSHCLDKGDVGGAVFGTISAVLVHDCQFERIDGGAIISSVGGYADVRDSVFRNLVNGRAITMLDVNKAGVGVIPYVMKLEYRKPWIRNVLIYNSSTSTPSDVVLDSTNIMYNGGGIYIKGARSDIDIDNVTIVDSSSWLFGGGIHIEDLHQSEVTISETQTYSCSSQFGGGVSVRNAKLEIEKNSFSSVHGCSSKFGGDLFFAFGNQELNINLTGSSLTSSDFGSTPFQLKLKSMFSVVDEEKNVNCYVPRTSKDCSYQTALLSVYPGEIFEIEIYVLDRYENILTNFPAFELKISGENDTDTLLVTFNSVQLLDSEVEEHRNYILFSNLQLVRKNIVETLKKPKIFTISIYSNAWIKNTMEIPIRILPCPKGTHVREENGGMETCLTCQEKSFSVVENAIVCRSCPDNAECKHDSIESSAGYWSDIRDDGEVFIQSCVNEKCLGKNECEGNYNSSLPLCGGCLEGYSEWSGECVKCENKVNPGYLLVWILLNSVVAIFFHLNNQETDSSIEKIITFYFQTAELILPHFGGIGALVAALSFAFSFSSPSMGDDDGESCPFQRTSYVRILMRSSVNPISLGLVFFLYVILLALCKCYCRISFAKWVFCFRTTDIGKDDSCCPWIKKQIKKMKKKDGEEEELEEGGEEFKVEMNEMEELGSSSEDDMWIGTDSSTSEFVLGPSTSESDDSADDSDRKKVLSAMERKTPVEKLVIGVWYILEKVITALWGVIWTKLLLFTRLEYFKVSFQNLLVVSYSLFMVSALQFFSCVEFYRKGEYFLQVNTDIKCFDRTWWAFSWFFMLLVLYVIIFPLIILSFLLCCRKQVKISSRLTPDEIKKDPKLQKNESRERVTKSKCCGLFQKRDQLVLTKEEKDIKFAKRWGSMFFTYKPRLVLWYEVYLLYRRFILIFFLIVGKTAFSPFVYGFFVIGILLLALLIHLFFAPYRIPSENRVETLSLITLIMLQVLKSTFPIIFEDGTRNFGIVLLYFVYTPAWVVCVIYKFSFLRVICAVILKLVVFVCCFVPKKVVEVTVAQFSKMSVDEVLGEIEDLDKPKGEEPDQELLSVEEKEELGEIEDSGKWKGEVPDQVLLSVEENEGLRRRFCENCQKVIEEKEVE